MSSDYQAYLLRIQRSSTQSAWRVTMENAHTGELLRFANKRDLLRYLMNNLMDETNPTSNQSKDEESKL